MEALRCVQSGMERVKRAYTRAKTGMGLARQPSMKPPWLVRSLATITQRQFSKRDLNALVVTTHELKVITKLQRMVRVKRLIVERHGTKLIVDAAGNHRSGQVAFESVARVAHWIKVHGRPFGPPPGSLKREACPFAP